MKALEVRLPVDNLFVRGVVGCAALFAEAMPSQKEAFCKGILEPSHTQVVSDCVAAFSWSHTGKPRGADYMRYRLHTLACNEEGHSPKSAAGVHVLGDMGGAYWIALECVKAAIAACEGIGIKPA